MKPFVICHMMVSLDGKIDGDYMERIASLEVGESYDSLIYKIGDSMAGGSSTAAMYFANAKIDYSKYDGQSVDREDFIPETTYKHYQFIFDRFGKCHWSKNMLTYANTRMNVVEVLTKKVSDAFLLDLRKKNIPYIFAGDEDMDLSLALEKIGNAFGVKNLVLTGGAIINGEFIKRNLVDELSLTMAPYIDGDPEHKCFAEGEDILPSFKFVKAEPYPHGGVRLIFQR